MSCVFASSVSGVIGSLLVSDDVLLVKEGQEHTSPMSTNASSSVVLSLMSPNMSSLLVTSCSSSSNQGRDGQPGVFGDGLAIEIVVCRFRSTAMQTIDLANREDGETSRRVERGGG